jgi:intracellular multiplication protein IcmO
MSGLIRGIESKHEHAAQMVARDTRPLGIRAAEFMTNPMVILALYVSSISLIMFFPAIADILFLVCACIGIFALTRQQVLPFKLPQSSALLDYNDPKAGTLNPGPAAGISFFGNDRVSREELWFNNSDMRTHVLIFGSTGSGKTEALISLAYNALIQASGFIYVDGKGDNSLFAKIFSMVRGMGRDDDLLTINFMTGARDVVGPQTNRLSNTMNPFANGSSSMLSQLVISLMDASSGDAGGDMWKGRAINFVESLMKILAVMRDAGHILLDANSIRDYFILEKLETIVVNKKFPIGDTGITVPIHDLPTQVLDPLRNYVMNLPGYNPAKKGNQAGEVLEQHGFITMQLTRVFGSLADTYGHILRTNLAEVDLKDVVLNRRILVVLLPALEKSPEELSNLGKIIIASLKAMMAAGLGDAVEGDFRDVIARKPTNSASPFMCIMDEYGYYAVKGFAIVAAQARSLGFSAIFAGQDLPAFQKASKEEAASIGANCNIKICMKLEDPQETWEFFNKAAGETYVTNVSSFQMQPNSLTMNYLDNRTTSVDRRQRIELLDLKDQREGEAHIFFKSRIIRAEMFFANPQPVKALRLSHFLKISTPPTNDLLEIKQRLDRFTKTFSSFDTKAPTPKPSEDIAILAHAFMESYGLLPIERGISGLIALLEHEVAAHKVLAQEYVTETTSNSMNIFTQVPVTAPVEKMIGKDNAKTFSAPLVRSETLFKDLNSIARLAGSSEDLAKTVTKNLMNDLERATSFPGPCRPALISKEQLLIDLNRILMTMGGRPYTPPVPEVNPFQDFADLPPLPDLPDLPEFADLERQLRSLEIQDLGLGKMPDINDPEELKRLQALIDLESGDDFRPPTPSPDPDTPDKDNPETDGTE